jgi:predicted DNA binding CopG/RHH family protein
MEVHMAQKITLDAFERSIESEVDQFAPVVGAKRRKIEAVLESARKTRSINIRINELDLASLKRTAQEEGIPYQTLISSVLHRYLSGRLLDEKHLRRSVELLSQRKAVNR